MIEATIDDFKKQEIIQNISLLCQGIDAEQKNSSKIRELKRELNKEV